MAKYKATHSCGHEHIHNLTGPEKDRQRKIEWMTGEDCPECFKAKKEATQAAQNEAAAEANAAAGLPSLQGTSKQIAWAETIRSNLNGGLILNKNAAKENQRLKARCEF